jgi:hypothetical protein
MFVVPDSLSSREDGFNGENASAGTSHSWAIISQFCERRVLAMQKRQQEFTKCTFGL